MVPLTKGAACHEPALTASLLPRPSAQNSNPAPGRYTSSYSDVVRARIVLYAADGVGNDEIAARLDTPRQVVSKWRKRFYDQRLAGLTDLPRAGRPPSFPPDVVVAIKALACELPAKTDTPLARGNARTWPAPPSSPASSPRSRAPRSGAG